MEKRKPITIIGCGPGDAGYLSGRALAGAAHVDCLVGSKRLLEMFPENGVERITVGVDIEKALDEIATRCEKRRVAVLVSGDPGISSLAGPVIKRFGRDRCEVIPGVSSVQIAFAKLGLDWIDAKIISAHDHNPDMDIEQLTQHTKIAVLGGRDESIAWIARLAKQLGDRRIFACEQLSLPEEKVTELTPAELAAYKAPSMTVVLLIKGESLL